MPSRAFLAAALLLAPQVFVAAFPAAAVVDSALLAERDVEVSYDDESDDLQRF